MLEKVLAFLLIYILNYLHRINKHFPFERLNKVHIRNAGCKGNKNTRILIFAFFERNIHIKETCLRQ